MKHFLSTAAILLLWFVYVNVLPAQDVSKMINGGILNGKAISLPKPAYPEEAKASKLEGMVRIKVVIDEEGNVESAEALNEPYIVTKTDADGNAEKVEVPLADGSLAEAARAAALQARFSPTKLSGVPVKVSGVITYNFVASESKMVQGPLNRLAIELPKPEYPPAAKAVRASGSVSVLVTIDEEGNVIAAEAASGHPLLRAAATDAALKAKFEPMIVNGSPSMRSGVITFNFVPPDVSKN